MSTSPDDDQTRPAQPLPDPQTAWWSADPWYDRSGTQGAAEGGPTLPGTPFGEPPAYGGSAGFGAAPVFGEPPNFGGANFGGGDFGSGGFAPPPPSDIPPYFAYAPQPQPPKSRAGRNLAAVLGALAVVTTLIVVLVVTGKPTNANASGAQTTAAATTTAPTGTDDSGSASPTDTSSDDAVPTDTASDAPTDIGFDPGTMDTSSTDTAPFTTDALLPQTFTDAKDIEYSLAAGGVETCVEDSMSANVRSTLSQYGCSQVLTGSYTVDSSAVAGNDDILVSVQVFAFKDEATAKAVYAAFPSSASWDFGIWCPKSGSGAKPCTADADYADAYKSEWLGQDYRYVVEATALYTDMSQDSSVEPWTAAAAKQAVDSAGPAYYISTQD